MTETIYVQTVTPRRTKAGEKFDIVAKIQQGGRWAPVFETFDQLAASLAMRAAELHFPVVVTWKQTPYGRDLVGIDVGRPKSAQAEGAA
jgi:hypothetical protein